MPMRRVSGVCFHVLDNDSLPKFQCPPASRAVVINISEMFDKILLKPTLRYDLQRLCLGVVHLNVPEICALQSDRRVEDFLKKRLKVIDGEQTGAELMKAGHRCQFGSEFIS